MPWVDYFSLLGQFLVGGLALSIVLDMSLMVIVNRYLHAKNGKYER